MRARIVQIGNSRGVRLPKSVLETAALGDDVEIRAQSGRIVIVSARSPRQGWAEEAKAMHEARDDKLIESPPTRFELEEWHWG